MTYQWEMSQIDNIHLPFPQIMLWKSVSAVMSSMALLQGPRFSQGDAVTPGPELLGASERPADRGTSPEPLLLS